MTRRELRYWRRHISLTAASDGNPIAWIRIGRFGVGIARVDGAGWPRLIATRIPGRTA